MPLLVRLDETIRRLQPGVGAFLVGMGIPGAMMASLTPQWAGSWGATGQYFSQTAILLLPAVAGWAAWCAGGDGRRSMRELVAGTRRGLAGAAMRIGAYVLLGALSGAMTALGVCLVVTARHGAGGWVPPLAALPVLGALATVVVLAALAGTALPTVVVPPGCVALVYLIQSAAAYQGSALADALSVAEFRSMTHAQLALVPVLARTLLWCAAAAAVTLTALSAWGHGPSHHRAALRRARALSLVACSLTSSMVLLTAGSDRTEDARSLAPVCRASQVTVCVTAAHHSDLAATAEWIEAALTPLGPVLPVPLVVVESGMAPAHLPRGTRVEVSFIDSQGNLVQQPERSTVQAQLLEGVLHDGCVEQAARGSRRTDLTSDVHRWLARRLHVPTDGSVMPGATPLDALPQAVPSFTVEHLFTGAGSASGRERLRAALPCLVADDTTPHR